MNTQLENELSDKSVDECWERAAATGVEHIWYNTKSGKYAYSDEAEQLSTIEYDTAADAITALTAYCKQLESCDDQSCGACIAGDGTECINNVQPITEQFSCCPITANCTEDNAKVNCVKKLDINQTHPIEVGNWGIPTNSYCNAEDPFGITKAAAYNNELDNLENNK